MKKLNQYFNAMPPARQKRVLVAFTGVFALLLTWSLRSNQLSINAGYAPKFIGHTTDPLTQKNKSWKNNANSY